MGQSTVGVAGNQPGEQVVFDFTAIDPSTLSTIWGALDDVVMGGVSASSAELTNQGLLFTGNVSTANSGGFASIRTRNFDPPLNLTSYAGMRLRLKGDGNRYKFLMRCDTGWDTVAYSYSFDTIADQWVEIYLPFSSLIPVFRARTRSDVPAFNPEQIYSLQLMLSKFEYDGSLNPHFTAGQFALQVASIRATGGH
ncbi:MAG TPA: CIA30 family protein [Coleofasciculaceae cyanobacterium]